jgi:hypothetical protein
MGWWQYLHYHHYHDPKLYFVIMLFGFVYWFFCMDLLHHCNEAKPQESIPKIFSVAW